LEEVLRMEYRSKLLNPRWAQAMAAQGSGGAYEISTRMTALLGWGGTVGYTDSFTWDQVGFAVRADCFVAVSTRYGLVVLYGKGQGMGLDGCGGSSQASNRGRRLLPKQCGRQCAYPMWFVGAGAMRRD
jgi:magnesium chelatase subunit H